MLLAGGNHVGHGSGAGANGGGEQQQLNGAAELQRCVTGCDCAAEEEEEENEGIPWAMAGACPESLLAYRTALRAFALEGPSACKLAARCGLAHACTAWCGDLTAMGHVQRGFWATALAGVWGSGQEIVGIQLLQHSMVAA